MVLPTTRVLINFINKQCEADEKDYHIGQNPVFSRGDPAIEDFIIDCDEDKQFGISEDMEATDRAPIRVRDIPDDLVEEYLRNAFSIPYTSETR